MNLRIPIAFHEIFSSSALYLLDIFSVLGFECEIITAFHYWYRLGTFPTYILLRETVLFSPTYTAHMMHLNFFILERAVNKNGKSGGSYCHGPCSETQESYPHKGWTFYYFIITNSITVFNRLNY